MVTQVVLTDEQVRAFSSSAELVELRDRHGKLLGSVRPHTPPIDEAEIIRLSRQRLASDQPRYSTAEVLQYLETLAARESQE